MIKFYGGPLDGTEIESVDPEHPFKVYPITKDENKTIGLYAMYRYEASKMIFVATKTPEQLLQMREEP